jgi:hypothetical protein
MQQHAVEWAQGRSDDLEVPKGLRVFLRALPGDC